MSRNRWIALMLVVAGIAGFSLAAVDQRAAAGPLTQTTGSTYWNYSVKFVCGFQPPQAFDQGEPPVKPGNYATDINIHNFTYNTVGIRKKVLVLVNYGTTAPNPTIANWIPGREPRQVQPRATRDAIDLRADGATMDDCNRIWELTFGLTAPKPVVMPLTIGYLVLISRVELDVDAVYTAEVTQEGQPTGARTGISIDVERVQGKKVFIPDTSFPGTPIPALVP